MEHIQPWSGPGDLSESPSPQGSAGAVEGQSGPREVTACAGAALRVGGCLLKVPGMSRTETTLFKHVQTSDEPETSGRKQPWRIVSCRTHEDCPREHLGVGFQGGCGPQAGRDPACSCPQPRWATEASASRGPSAPGPRDHVGGSGQDGEEQESQGWWPARVLGNSVPPSLQGSPQGGPRHPSCDWRWLWFCRAPGCPQDHCSEGGCLTAD